MDKKIMLSIVGTQRSPEGENYTIELVTEGRLYKKGDSYCIEYEETAICGLEGTRTLIIAEGDRVSLERCGQHRSCFVFAEGRKYINFLETPYGSLEMSVFPTTVSLCMEENKGKLDLKYQFNIAGKYASSNQFSLSYYENLQNRTISS